MDFTLELVKAFMIEKWWIIAGALVAIIIVIRIAKAIVKWVLILAIVAGVLFYAGSSADSLTASLKEKAVEAAVGEQSSATYEANPDGSFSLKTDNFTIQGSASDPQVELLFRGISLGKFDLNDTLSALIAAGKAAQQ